MTITGETADQRFSAIAENVGTSGNIPAPPPNDECTTLDDGSWHFCPDNSLTAHHGCVDLDVTRDHIQVVNPRPAPGTVLNLTSATPGWTITFTRDRQSWSSPIVAWAALASNYGHGMIDPVLIADGQTVTLQTYLEGQGPLLEVLDDIDYEVTWSTPGVATPSTPDDLSALATVTVTGCWTLPGDAGCWFTREAAEAHRDKLADEGWTTANGQPLTDPVRATGYCRTVVCATCGTHRTNWEGVARHHPTATEAITAAVTAGSSGLDEWDPGDAWSARPDGRLDCPECATTTTGRNTR